MPLSTAALEEFKEIYKAEFRIELSDSDASEMATRLLNMFSILQEQTN